jgi:methylated-DNA-[protein]-cysteine S-methyltransferase
MNDIAPTTIATTTATNGATAHPAGDPLDAVNTIARLGGTMTDPLDAGRARRLHERLVERAGRDGVLDVAYRVVDSPLGALLLAATGAGVTRVAFALEDHDRVLQELADAISPRILLAPGRLDEAARQLEDYFAGRRTTFSVPVDLRLAGGFRRQVLEQLRTIRYGTTASYAAIAAAAGRPAAVRAVGTACARNPVPLVVPCHRVVRSDGTIGQYRGGSAAKHLLLDLERAA